MQLQPPGLSSSYLSVDVTELHRSTSHSSIKENTRTKMGQGIRLVSGLGPCIGRVEIFKNNSWGTVCDDYWDINDAAVACRQLGCGRAISAHNMAFFGEGSGKIWLSGVICEGSESSLTQCSSSTSESHGCEHRNDAGVVCSASLVVILGAVVFVVLLLLSAILIAFLVKKRRRRKKIEISQICSLSRDAINMHENMWNEDRNGDAVYAEGDYEMPDNNDVNSNNSEQDYVNVDLDDSERDHVDLDRNDSEQDYINMDDDDSERNHVNLNHNDSKQAHVDLDHDDSEQDYINMDKNDFKRDHVNLDHNDSKQAHIDLDHDDSEQDYINMDNDEQNHVDLDNDGSEQDYINVDCDNAKEDRVSVNTEDSEQDYVNVDITEDRRMEDNNEDL